MAANCKDQKRQVVRLWIGPRTEDARLVRFEKVPTETEIFAARCQLEIDAAWSIYLTNGKF